MAMLVEG